MFKFGIAKADITPELGSLLYGYPSERHAERIMDKLTVGAAYLADDNTSVLLMNTELCAFSVEVCAEIRKAVSDATGVAFDNITYAVTHTHSGPVTHTSEGWGTTDTSYIDTVLVPASIKAATEAIESAQQALMATSTVECYAGINRRQHIDGKVELGQNPDGAYDPTMVVMSFKSPEGKALGTLVHFATHPTVAGANLSVTRDWPGVLVDKVEENTNALCMYYNGAEGNVGPRLLNGRTTGSEEDIYYIGGIVAKSAMEALEKATDYIEPKVSCYTEDILLPFSKEPTVEELDAKREAMGNPDDLYITDLRLYKKLGKIKEMLLSGETLPKGVTHRQTVIAVGDLAIVPVCFEAFTEIAMNLRAKSPYSETIAMGITSGTRSYLPTEEELPYGGYEVTMFRTSALLSYADNLDKIVVDEYVKLLNKLEK